MINYCLLVLEQDCVVYVQGIRSPVLLGTLRVNFTIIPRSLSSARDRPGHRAGPKWGPATSTEFKGDLPAWLPSLTASPPLRQM